ncbi:hypothetical protein [Aquibacillus rhizosphaerae]|uniref:DUF4083 domain-containing protein n=1 Tax=Aquibacillus rhizosphaerae TaxID=3051431 RepID=A0ABT7L286_9BACI|nr:hypothetical protein [Aquibacillus sp. LR5S19]MDL4839966.1 hypothetical protein [Aquibacillus sp. LR5S19]
MLVVIGSIAIFITLISIELQLRKVNKNNEEVVELLKQIKEKK